MVARRRLSQPHHRRRGRRSGSHCRAIHGLFKEQPELKLELTVASVQFVSPNVAIEHGHGEASSPGTEPEEIDYSAVDVKRDGKWLLDRVTDKSKEVAAVAL